ncbi:MAG: PfkB family carbohydrate kinase [Acidimicrobiales bacterium]
MSNTAQLFCLDHVLIDVVLRVDVLPTRGGDVRAHETLLTTGGGFNAMSAAARHDMPVTYAGRLGDGPFSSLALKDLAREGITTPVAPSHDLDAGFCVVLVEPDGERSFVTSPGAELTLSVGDLDALDIKKGDYVLVSGYNIMYPGTGEEVLEWLRSLPQGVIIAFDPAARMVDIPAVNLGAVTQLANWLFCNASEAQALTGEIDVVASALVMQRRYRELDVLIRNGESGCVLARHGHEVEVVPGFETVVVDTNGAGDAHSGVFLSELARGSDVVAAARWANAAAAMAISHLGPATCPTREQVNAWISTRDSTVNLNL